MSYTFEDITIEHQKSIIEIFNYYVVNSFAAYNTVPLGEEIFERFHKMSEGYPFKVIKYNETDIVGFAYREGTSYKNFKPVY